VTWAGAEREIDYNWETQRVLSDILEDLIQERLKHHEL